MTTYPPLRAPDFDDRRPLKRREPKPCPVCYNPMRPVGKDEFECAKHGIPAAKVEAPVERKRRMTVPMQRLRARHDEILERNRTESVVEIAESLWEDLGYKHVVSAQLAIRRYFDAEGIALRKHNRRRPPVPGGRPR